MNKLCVSIMSSNDDDIEDIRRKRLLDLRRQVSDEQQRDAQQKEFESQKDAAIRQILTYEARQRLNRIKLVKPEFVEQIELQLIQIAQSGKVRLPIDDGQLRQILMQLQSTKKEITFRRV